MTEDEELKVCGAMLTLPIRTALKEIETRLEGRVWGEERWSGSELSWYSRNKTERIGPNPHVRKLLMPYTVPMTYSYTKDLDDYHPEKIAIRATEYICMKYTIYTVTRVPFDPVDYTRPDFFLLNIWVDKSEESDILYLRKDPERIRKPVGEFFKNLGMDDEELVRRHFCI